MNKIYFQGQLMIFPIAFLGKFSTPLQLETIIATCAIAIHNAYGEIHRHGRRHRRITCAIAIHNAQSALQKLKRETETSLAHTPDVTQIVCNRPVRSHIL